MLGVCTTVLLLQHQQFGSDFHFTFRTMPDSFCLTFIESNCYITTLSGRNSLESILPGHKRSPSPPSQRYILPTSVVLMTGTRGGVIFHPHTYLKKKNGLRSERVIWLVQFTDSQSGVNRWMDVLQIQELWFYKCTPLFILLFSWPAGCEKIMRLSTYTGVFFYFETAHCTHTRHFFNVCSESKFCWPRVLWNLRGPCQPV